MQHTAAAANAPAPDIATRIAATMRQMGVMGLPRNYEIFYEICTGSNETLCEDVRLLGNRPTQEQLDLIARKYFAGSNGSSVIDDARDQVASKIEDVMALLRKERSSLEKYGQILDRTSDGLQHNAINQEILIKIVSIMSTATDSTIEQGRQIATSMLNTSAELDHVKSTLEEYKKLADTDALTQIWNRRAFDRAMTRVFSSEKSKMFGALILGDIDMFKSVNDRHGHPIGDRILQLVARLISSNAHDGAFVARTGGEEFAIIAEGLSEESINRMAETIRAAIEKAPFISTDGSINYGPITFSLGLCMATEAHSAEDLYTKADRALYASKMSGRNRVTKHSSLGAQLERRNWSIYRKD